MVTPDSDKLVEAGLPVDYQIPLEPGVHVVQGVPLELNVTRVESDLRAVEDYEVINRLTESMKGNNRGLNQSELAGKSDSSLTKPLAWLLVGFFCDGTSCCESNEKRKT